MTITSTPSEIAYATDGVTTVFPIPFAFDTVADLKVTKTDSSGNVVVLTTGFSVSGGGGSTGSLTLSPAVASGYTLTILDDPERVQDADYVSNDAFPAESHEKALDHGVRLSKRLWQLIQRCIRTTDGDPISSMTLGSVDTRKGKYLFFDAVTGAIEYATAVVGSVLSRSIIGQFLNPQTAAEVAASVVPTNYFIDGTFFDPRRYGAVGDGVTDDHAALQVALNVAGINGGTVKLPAGLTFFCTTNLTVPTGINNAVDIEGASWTHGGIKFSGTSVTTGLTYTGSSYDYCGEIRNLRVYCVSGAKRGATFTNVQHVRITRCAFHGAAGAGLMYDTVLMSELSHTLVISCGSATESSIEVTGVSTTWKWNHSRVSNAGDTTQGGLRIDQTFDVTMTGGNIETAGIPLQVGSKTNSTRGCVGGVIHGVDFENPGNNNPYIDFGSGLSSSATISAWDIRGNNGSPSGTTTVPFAVRMKQCIGLEFGPNNWAQASGTSTYELTGTSNLGIVIRAHRNLFNVTSGIPWVRVNGTWVKAAGALVDWISGEVTRGSNQTSLNNGGGATPSVLTSTSQGGFYRQMTLFNASATTITALTDGERGMEIYVSTTNGNTTLTHSTSTANQFNLTGGVNLTMAAGRLYQFIHNGTVWVQV